MISLVLRSIVVGFLFLMTLGGLALVGQADKWWIAVGLAVAGYFGGAWLIMRSVKSVFTAPFKAKGAVLRGARLEVHALVPALVTALASATRGPESGTTDDGDSGERRTGWRYFEVDATVVPETPAGPFHHWELAALDVVPLEADCGPDASPYTREMSVIEKREYFEDGRFVEDDGLTFMGAQRVRLTVGVAPSLHLAKLRYYFEAFGAIDLG